MNSSIVWFRNDLRIEDNPALEYAAKHGSVTAIYIFENSIGAASKWWLHYSLKSLATSLKQKYNLELVILKGNPQTILEELVAATKADAIYWNRRYDKDAIATDKKIKEHFSRNNIEVKTFNSSLLLEPWDVKTKQGDYYKVFTPYWRECRSKLGHLCLTKAPDKIEICNVKLQSLTIDELNLLPKNPNWAEGFSKYWQIGEQHAFSKLNNFLEANLANYSNARDYPELDATSKLSPHLHFGEISPRQIFKEVEFIQASSTIVSNNFERYLAELGWREFSYSLLYHFPDLQTKSFKANFNNFPWQENKEHLKAWQRGLTGYPIVDAGMRELWQTGYMHNRVRMIVASFLTKDLLIPWQIGEQWFFDTLVDADIASNSASWQWVAGSGADAAPYFRIFNPITQSMKFDPDGNYIKRWVPELKNLDSKQIHAPNGIVKNYPTPIIDHDKARKLALDAYKKTK